MFAVGVLLSIPSFSQEEEVVNIPKKFKLADYNYVLGTQMIGGKYKFTDDSYLIEQAKQVRSMGSNILKISLGNKYTKVYGMKKDESIKTTLDLVKKKKDFQKVMDMDFKYIFMWVHTLTDVKWNKGMSTNQKMKLYREMYDFTSYLLKEYNNSGKVFMIGNWEGDWLLHGTGKRNIDPSDEKIKNMKEWFQIRQAAVDAAKKDVKHKNVQLFHYVEVNLLLKGLEGKKCIAESILPHVNVDMVSYSSYEAIKNKNQKKLTETLKELMDYTESKLQPKEGIPFKRRVFIGEYGYPDLQKGAEWQNKMTKMVMISALELDLPFALHWEMYNNEYVKDGKNKGKSKGMSLISEEGVRKPAYYLHKNFYLEMTKYLKDYKKENKKYPVEEEFNQKALEYLKSI